MGIFASCLRAPQNPGQPRARQGNQREGRKASDLLIKVGGNTDAPASDNTSGATFECKHAWLERRRQHLVFLVLKAD